MDKKDLQNLITIVDNSLKNYANVFSTTAKPIESIFQFKTHNTQEYTNAHIVTNCLNDYFVANSSCKITVRELPVNYLFSSSTISSAKSEIQGYEKYKKVFREKTSFFVDAYFDVDIDVVSLDPTINGQHIKYLFAEYKVSSTFKYLALAEDFIKYKIYTSVTEFDTAFVFIVFDKKPIYPTILKCSKPDYFLIPKIINSSMFSKNDRIFIYIPKKYYPTLASKASKMGVDNLIRVEKILSRITSITDDVKESDLIEDKCFKYTSNFYFDNIGALKNNVSTAKILVANYLNFIMPLYDYLCERGFILSDDEIDKNRLYEIKKNFKKYELALFGDKKTRSIKEGLSSGYKSSLNVLTLLNALTKEYGVNIEPSLPAFESETESSTEMIYYKEILEENTNLTIQKWEFGNYSWMKNLALEMLIFIVKLYEKVFDYDDEGNFKFSDEFELTRKTRRLQKLIDDLIKELGYSHKINIFNDDIELKTADLFKFIYILLFGNNGDDGDGDGLQPAN